MWFMTIVRLLEYNVNVKYVWVWIMINVVQYIHSHKYQRMNEPNDNVINVDLLKGFLNITPMN